MFRPWPIACAVVLAAGCAPHPKPIPAAIPTTRPAIKGPPVVNISRGAGGVPLDDLDHLDSLQSLDRAIFKAFQDRFILVNEAATVTAVGDQFPHLDSLQIDISNSNVRSTYRPTQYGIPLPPQPGITVGRFDYLAWPLLYQHGATRWRMSASNARFSLVRDRPTTQPGKAKPSTQPARATLILTDCRDGSFEFAMKLADFKPMLMGSATENGSKAFILRDVDLHFDSDGPHSLAAMITVKAFVLLVPTSFRVHARADIDTWCNVHFSELSCQGLDPGGVLLAAFINPPLQKYDGKVQPLMRWPEDRIVLSDVQIHLDDSLNVAATFGHNPEKR